MRLMILPQCVLQHVGTILEKSETLEHMLSSEFKFIRWTLQTFTLLKRKKLNRSLKKFVCEIIGKCNKSTKQINLVLSSIENQVENFQKENIVFRNHELRRMKELVPKILIPTIPLVSLQLVNASLIIKKSFHCWWMLKQNIINDLLSVQKQSFLKFQILVCGSVFIFKQIKIHHYIKQFNE